MTSRVAPSVSRIRLSKGASASASRCAMPLDGSSSNSTVGSCASTHARSTMRRLPVDSSWMNLSRNARRPTISMSSSTRLRTRRSESMTFGRWSAAAIGLRTLTWVSSATAMVSCTVSAGNSLPSWNERPSPSLARA